MVHELTHTAWDWLAAQFQLSLAGYEGKLVVVGLLATTAGIAIVLFHFVEEPARRWMRRLVEVQDTHTSSEIDATGDSVKGKLQSIDGGLEPRTQAVSVRAV
jgi:peptidoglycan/LPS O-acetylase OafA/YrhL